MTANDWAADLRSLLSEARGSLVASAPLAPLTWFKTGGAAELLFTPADEDDLCAALGALPAEVPVTVIGLGSNLIVRDGGVPGLVIRLGKAFAGIEVERACRLRAGSAAPDVKVARMAAEASIDGLSFLRGIPGSIGGALPTNAGAHGGEIADIFVEARAVDRQGHIRVFSKRDMGFAYRHCSLTLPIVFTQAVLEGRPGESESILAEMNRVTAAREASQPIREKTGGSTFANPPGHSAWRLIDEAGCRGLIIGDAQVSPMHTNFLINRGAGTSSDIEKLGEEVRRRVLETSGIELRWEIRRIGVSSDRHS